MRKDLNMMVVDSSTLRDEDRKRLRLYTVKDSGRLGWGEEETHTAKANRGSSAGDDEIFRAWGG
jgi:hypothetical protein